MEKDEMKAKSTPVKFRSIVANAIDFEPEEEPTWRTGSTVEYPSNTMAMIEEIVQFRKEFDQLNFDAASASYQGVRKHFISKYIFWLKGLETEGETEECIKSVESNVGEGAKIYSTEEKTTINCYKTYLWLEEKVKNNENSEDYGFLEGSLVKTAHEKIMEGLQIKKGKTKPGECSNRPREATYKGKPYNYPHHPEAGEMEEVMSRYLDQYNTLINSIKVDDVHDDEDGGVRRTLDFFKACSWLLFNLLDLHPFSDGNGRLCRLLCNYALSVFNPIPTPIYNSWSASSRDDYVQALVDARGDKDRHPKALTTMLIECNWFAWKEFLKELKHLQEAQGPE